jgi:hypothetical protein
MDKKGRPATGQGKEEEGDYVRNKSRTIARKLCIILDINVPGDIFKTVLELVYFKKEAVRNQRAVPIAWQEQMAIEGRPNAGQGAQEESNYVHQPQLEPRPGPMGKEGRLDAGQGEAHEGNYVQYYQGWQAQEPMNEEADEVMAREGPTLEQREEAYIRNKNNSIIHRLCTMLEI